MAENEKKITFREILKLISDKRLGFSLKKDDQVVDNNKIDERATYREIEATIKANIELLKAGNESFRSSYFNLTNAESYPAHEALEEDLIKMIYLNQLPTEAKIILAQALNANREKQGLKPLIATAINKNGEEVALIDEGKVSTEDMFNRQFINKMEDLYRKTIAILTKRPADILSDTHPKNVCDVQKTYNEIRNTVLLAEAFGFEPSKIMESSEIPGLYSFSIRGVAYNTQKK